MFIVPYSFEFYFLFSNMKKTYTLILSCLAFLMVGITPSVQAQITGPGDLAIVYYHSDCTGGGATVDTVTILTLVPITTGDKFYLTDQSWHNDPTEEFDVDGGTGAEFTASQNYPAFSLIIYDQSTVNQPGSEWVDYRSQFGSSVIIDDANSSNNCGSNFFSPTGDQAFLFLDADGTGGSEPAANPTMIFGLNSNNTGWLGTAPDASPSPRESALPSTLGGASIDLGGGPGHQDNYIYTGSTLTFTDKADALTHITNTANWTGSSFDNPVTGTMRTRTRLIHNGPNPFSGPSLVPTLSEWAMMILALMMLAMGSVAILASRQKLATAGSAGFSMFAPRSLPFDGKLFAKVLAFVFAAMIVGFGVAMLGFGYELMTFDVPGVLISSPIAAYVVHLWMKK